MKRKLRWVAFLFAATVIGSAHAQSCVSDDDCQDGVWCNGIERCEGPVGRAMCMPAPRPMCPAKKLCAEGAKRCVTQDVGRKMPVCPEGQAYSVADEKCVATPP